MPNLLEASYQPKSFEDFIFPSDYVEAQIMSYVFGDEVKPLLLFGGWGGGKSVIAQLICDFYEATGAYILKIDARDESESTKDKLKHLLHEKAFYDHIETTTPIKRVVRWCEFKLDSKLTNAAKRYLDIFPTTHLLICSCNYKEYDELDVGVKQRFNRLEIPVLTPTQMLPYASRILAEQSVNVSEQTVLRLLEDCDPSVRAYFEKLSALINYHKYKARKPALQAK
jgi:hypothetical protein